MKKIKWYPALILIFFIQSACNLPVSIANNQGGGLKPTLQKISTETPPVVSTMDLNGVLPTQTSLPLIAATFTNSSSETPLPVPSETQTLFPTQTVDSVFSSVNLSNQVIFQACDPKSVHFQVTTVDSAVYSVVFFFRVRYKVSGDKTNWSEGYAMQPIGGKFVYDLKSSSLSDFNKIKEPVAWVQFQLVTTDKSGSIIARSQVYADKLTISSLCP
ncbi:MAG: hypothetical protein WCP19_13400 [Chloroflexota bacterium]